MHRCLLLPLGVVESFVCRSFAQAYLTRPWMRASRCEMCNSPNPDPVFAESGEDTPPKPTTVWVCPACANENPVGAKQCQVCKHEFPQSPEKPGASSSESRAEAAHGLVLSTSVLLSSDEDPPKKDGPSKHAQMR